MCSDFFYCFNWLEIYILESRLHVGDFSWSCEHLFMDQQFVVILLLLFGEVGWAVLLLLLVAISVRFATVVIDGANEKKNKKNNCTICLYPRFCYFHCFMLFFFRIHVCFHAVFHSVLKHNTIQVLLLSIMVVAELQKIAWINYVLIDRLQVIFF